MRELTTNEIENVSGAFLFSFLGETIIDAVKIINDVLNTNLVSSVGRFFDAIGLGSIHYAADSIGYGIFSAIAGIGALLGGDAERIDYHFNNEWGA
ncbi:hypothetical protein [Pantoea brenneri]|uniref:hypothetical protein n=1 Tax=Pantoea brenneri TaxID=472694 RepID=UPI00289648D3|nr:hypothetical protein [Pantoea brenneri]